MSLSDDTANLESVDNTETGAPKKHVSARRATTPTAETPDPQKTPATTPPTSPQKDPFKTPPISPRNDPFKTPPRTPPHDPFKTPPRTQPKNPPRTPPNDPLDSTPKSPEPMIFPEESYHTPVKGSKKRPRDSPSFPLKSTPKYRKTDAGPSCGFRSTESAQNESEDPPTPEFVSPTRRRRFLAPRPDPKAFDQVTSEMLLIEAPKHLMELIPKSLLLNKNCVEAAFDWLLAHWSNPEETLELDGVRLEQLYSTDQEELRKSSSFTEFEIDLEGELRVTKIVELDNRNTAHQSNHRFVSRDVTA